MIRSKRLVAVLLVLALVAFGAHATRAAKGGKPGKPGDEPPPADPAIAFVTWYGEDDVLYVMNEDGSNVTEIARSADRLISPTWSPDGDEIAYVIGHGELWRVSVSVIDGVVVHGDPEWVHTNEYGIFDPRWSPTGDEIVFVANSASGIDSLRVIPPEGGTPQVIYTDDAGSNLWEPTWSPEADRIAFIGGGIKILHRSTGEVTQALPPQETGGTALEWARTQDVIAFMQWLPGKGNRSYRWVRTLDLETGEVTSVIRGHHPTWSPNDDRLAFLAPKGGVWTYEFATGAVVGILGVEGLGLDWARR
jgi:Tol biopolymer transport system component